MLFSIILYNSILLFSIALSYFSEWTITKTQRLVSRVILFMILFTPAALRYGIGTDYNSYIEIYNGDIYDGLEIGFLYIVSLCHFLQLSNTGFMAFMSLLTLFPICFFLNRKYFSWVIPIYIMLFYFQTYSIVRQALSVSLIICSIQYYIDHKYWRSLFFLVFATMFHFSAFLILPFLLIGKIRLNSFISFLITLLFVLFILKSNFFEMIFNNPLFQSSKYAGYENTAYGGETELGSGSGVIAAILFPLLFILLSKNIVLHNKNLNLLVVLSIFFVISQVLSAKIHIFNRIFDTIRYLPMFLYPYFYYNSSIKNKKLVVFLFLLILFALFEKNLIGSLSSLNSGLGVIPYVSIFD